MFLELIHFKGHFPPPLMVLVQAFGGRTVTQPFHYQEIEQFGALGKKVNFLYIGKNCTKTKFKMNEFYYYGLLRKDEKYLMYMLKDLSLFTNCCLQFLFQILIKFKLNRLLKTLLVPLSQHTCSQISFTTVNQQKFTRVIVLRGTVLGTERDLEFNSRIMIHKIAQDQA